MDMTAIVSQQTFGKRTVLVFWLRRIVIEGGVW